MRVYGRNSVIERLRSNPQTIRKIYIENGLSGGTYIRKKARQHNIPLFSVPKSKIQKIGRSLNTQGVLADIGDFEYENYEAFLDTARQKKFSLLFLDGIKDPQNLGAIVRTAGCLGHFAVIIPTHKSVSITETVLKVASGGDNYVKIIQVANIANAIKKAKDVGYWIAGTVVKDGTSVYDMNIQFPVGLVIGSEQKGIRPVLENVLDSRITIPMHIHTMSLNAAQAAGLMCFEISRQSQALKNRKANV